MRYVPRKHANDWKEIGLELKLDCDMLNIIEAGYPYGNQEAFFAMIKRWIMTDCDATWRKVLEAVENGCKSSTRV